MKRMSIEDHVALLNSETYQELEKIEIARLKQAQSLSDKIIQSPTAQKAISDGITRALENKDDDGEITEPYHQELKHNIAKLKDHELFEMHQMFTHELEERGLDTPKYEKEFAEEEMEETEEDEEKEDEDMAEVFAFVKSSLTKIAYNCADRGDTESAYLIERFITKIS